MDANKGESSALHSRPPFAQEDVNLAARSGSIVHSLAWFNILPVRRVLAAILCRFGVLRCLRDLPASTVLNRQRYPRARLYEHSKLLYLVPGYLPLLSPVCPAPDLPPSLSFMSHSPSLVAHRIPSVSRPIVFKLGRVWRTPTPLRVAVPHLQWMGEGQGCSGRGWARSNPSRRRPGPLRTSRTR